MVFELFADVVPKTAENFRALCTGEKGVGETTISPLYYRGTRFHNITKGLMAQGGDFSKNNGTGGESIYGGTFEDENFVLRHDDRGLLSMANTGPNTNGSQFFITFKPLPHLDRKNTVFGKLILGDDVLKKIECVDVDGSTPLVRVKIVNCGMHMEINDHGSMASKNDKMEADNSNLSNYIASGGKNTEHKPRSHSKRSSKDRESTSPRGSIKRPSINPVKSSRSTSPARQSISGDPCGQSPSRSPSRSASRSLDTPLSRSRSKNTSSSDAQTRSFSERSRRSHNASPEVSSVQRRISRSPPVSRRRSTDQTRSVSRSPVRSKRRRSRSHERSSGRNSAHRPTSHHRSRRSAGRGASPPCSRRERSLSSDHGGSPSRSGGSSDGAPKHVRKGRGFTPRYSFVRRYRSPSPNGLSVRGHYGGRNKRDRYTSYQSSHHHRRYRSSSRGRVSPRHRSRS
ncbi:unnamed protein product [Urochloa humidicola]